MQFASRESFVTLLFPLASAIVAAPQTASPTLERDARVEELLRQMTLEEKVAQLSQLPGIHIPYFIEAAAGQAEDVIQRVGAGSVLWVSDPKEMNRLQHIAMEQSRLHIPILFGLDVIPGYHTIFPAPLAMASSWDPKLVEDVQTVAAKRSACRRHRLCTTSAKNVKAQNKRFSGNPVLSKPGVRVHLETPLLETGRLRRPG